MTAPFTLIAFNCHQVDLEDRLKQPNALAQVLESTAAHRTEICLGVYVFETQKGWQDIHRLCEFLRIQRHSFVRLPFEGELFASVAPAVDEALRKQGVTLFQYPRDER
jgi:hypothetical protein